MTEPGAVVTAFISAIEAKDTDGATRFLHPDVSYENMPMAPVKGAEATKAILDMFLADASEVEWKILFQHEAGHRVFNERVDRFKIGEGWLELPIAGVFEVDGDGLITLWRDYFDMATYQRQKGTLQ